MVKFLIVYQPQSWELIIALTSVLFVHIYMFDKISKSMEITEANNQKIELDDISLWCILSKLDKLLIGL